MILTDKLDEKFYSRLYTINPIFGLMWKRGKLEFSDEYEVAAVEIIRGRFKIVFNPEYWKRITNRNREFIICHEYLHVILGHWLNAADESTDAEWNAIAQDIQVNEMLTRRFGFCRSNVRGWRDQPWIDVVFKDKASLVKVDGDSDYYYGLIMQCLPKA
jgi:predicted SprT family Zn-dependent metalloprotease